MSQMTASSVKPHTIAVRGAAGFAWRTFKKRFGLFMGIVLTVCGAWVVLEVVVIAGQRFGIVWWAAAHLLFLTFFAGMEAGLFAICLEIYDRGEPTFADSFRRLAWGPKFLTAQLIYLVLVAAGLVLLVVPGLYLGVRYAWFGFSLVDGRSDMPRALQHSAQVSEGAKFSLLALIVWLVVFNMLGACLLGVGLFVTAPMSALMMAAVYRQLSGGGRPRSTIQRG